MRNDRTHEAARTDLPGGGGPAALVRTLPRTDPVAVYALGDRTAHASVWPRAVLRDDGTIAVGERTSIQDGTVVHATHDKPKAIGADMHVENGARHRTELRRLDRSGDDEGPLSEDGGPSCAGRVTRSGAPRPPAGPSGPG